MTPFVMGFGAADFASMYVLIVSFFLWLLTCGVGCKVCTHKWAEPRVEVWCR
jgi:hypothetical protein